MNQAKTWRAQLGIAEMLSETEHVDLLSWLADSCQRFAERPVFSSLGASITFADLDRLSMQFAAWIQQATPLQPGDRVAIQLPSLMQYPVVLFGALRAGLVVVNTNPLYTVPEMQHQFRDAGVRALIVLESLADKAQAVLPETGIETVVTVGLADLHPAPRRWLVHAVARYFKGMGPSARLAGAVPLRRALALGRGLRWTPPLTTGDSLAVLQYTGGTTGVPKAAMLTHANLLANALQCAEMFRTYGFDDSRASVFLQPLPLYHIYAFMLALVMIHTGNHTVLVPNPRDIRALLREWQRQTVHGFAGLNTLFVALCQQADFAGIDFSGLRVTVSGGMALTRGAAEEWQAVTGTEICEGYGLTETSPVVAVNPGNGNRPGTVGLPLPSTEIAVFHDGQPQAAGERGELCVRGPQVMAGYWQRPEETTHVLDAEGWLHTGDVATVDEAGYIRIVDRMKDLILVSGFNVYPGEVEDVASGHPGVLECAAIGVPDVHSGEVVRLFVVRRDDSLKEADLQNWLKARLTGYKQPRSIRFVDSLPKSAVGKVLRRELRDTAKA